MDGMGIIFLSHLNTLKFAMVIVRAICKSRWWHVFVNYSTRCQDIQFGIHANCGCLVTAGRFIYSSAHYEESENFYHGLVGVPTIIVLITQSRNWPIPLIIFELQWPKNKGCDLPSPKFTRSSKSIRHSIMQTKYQRILFLDKR